MLKVKKFPKLTKQEKKFVKVKAETGNGTLAAKEAFEIEDDNYAGVKANRLLRKDKIVNAIQEALPDELLVERHLELLNTRNEYNWYENIKDVEGKNVIEVKRHTIDLGVDVTAVSKGLDLAYKLKGSYAAEKHISINAQVNIENKQQVEGIASKVLEQMKNEEIV